MRARQVPNSEWLHIQAMKLENTQLKEEAALRRKQLRNAWAKLGCRCIFNDQDEKTTEDEHCPYHGFDQIDPDGWDPIGELRRDLNKADTKVKALQAGLKKISLCTVAVIRGETGISNLSLENVSIWYSLGAARILEDAEKS